MPKIKIKSYDLYYEIYGEGFPLLMILGIGANISWWGKYFLTGLAKHFKVIAFDNRGTGLSGDPNEDYLISTLADDAKVLLDFLNIDEIYIFGHSMGGYIAQEYALNYTGVKKLILCSSSCGGNKSVLASPEVVKILEKPRNGRDPEEIAEDNLKLFYSNEFMEKNTKLINFAIQNMVKSPIDPVSFHRQTKAIELFDSSDRLKKLEITTLVLHGMKDILVPPQNAYILAELIPHSQLKTFPESAHAPFVEEPDLVLRTIIEFLI
ncbi:MAG: alpha/beta fold hydrolase [Candidatus Hermodarchaeota archaeon]